LDLPSGLKVVANGNWVRTEALAEGFSRSVWQQDGAIPSYLFGFAAGRFREVIDTTATPNLHFLGPEEFSEQQLRQIFQDTRSMLTFYADKAGLPYPGSRYTQVLVGEAQAQEAAGFALLSEAYGRRLLADPQQAWLVAHEVSHQWWGNGVTNRAWTHFWLNEGLASFMNAAWFEHRYGREAYLLHMDGALAKYERVRAAAADKPLHFPAWQSPTAMDRSLVYDKGATLVARYPGLHAAVLGPSGALGRFSSRDAVGHLEGPRTVVHALGERPVQQSYLTGHTGPAHHTVKQKR
jgi:aminopeptidase N